ncbi:hypothetical protein BDA99DRAFT_441428 [Phascolomyces articulosus]|uniref:Uncharacterized protein n=1 Tax=Phascolomyces articulosus TaxID=60185 RepID=A0AAD5PCD9_9FUNG|nr:hypothetical protein BDA99DRAFT_441428 [Phascolomyces articulosus]
MKHRFNSLDIRATVSNLKERLTGLRLQNIYDVNAKTFLLKFAKPDDKELIRKYLRTRRVTSIRQLGVDRIVDFEFAGGDKSFGYHIIVEFYAAGNVIFTDDKYNILALLRVVNTEDTKMAVGEVYNIQTAVSDFTKVDPEKLQQVLRNAGPKHTLKKVLTLAYDYGPAMMEHIILKADLDPNMKAATEFDSSLDSPMMKALIQAFREGDEMVESTKNNVPKGYIILLDDVKPKEGEEDNRLEIYDEFHPYLYKQYESRPYKEFNTFDSAVDEFFSAIEAQKIELKARNQEEAAMKKLEAVRKEQENRVQVLVDQQTTNVRKAQLIELNLEMVEAAITIIRNAVASQMDWRDLNELVAEEKKRGNPIADIIHALKLETNQITLLLTDPEEYDSEESFDDSDSDNEEEEKEEKPKAVVPHKVDVEIGLTAFANARKYYDQKRSTASKHEKTLKASSKAMKSAERKIRKDLKDTKITTTINKIRKPFWFEKFLWFISTEGHLIIAGKDMQQNEMLVKRYLQKDDVYVHADLHGAASVVVKNKPENAGKPIPPSTLFQAGIMSVCQSKAWDAKIVTSAYWVHADQVSKSAPTGEYLTTGSFMIRGKKNFLPPVQLVYGFGYLFKLDESSIGNHISEKRSDQEEQDENNEQIPNEGQESSLTKEAAVEQEESTTDGVSPEDTGDEKKATPVDDGESSDDISSSEDEDEAFPDTQLAPTTITTATASTAGWKKYDLEDYGEDADALPEFARPTKQTDNKTVIKAQSIIAKERRQMKKGKSTGGTGTNDSNKQAKSNKASASKEPVPQQIQARGKRGKAKKIKQKYGDQDDEERQLRMELLGSNKGPQPKGKKAKKEAQVKAEKLAREKEREKQRAAMEAARAAEAAEVAEANHEVDADQIVVEEGEDKEEIRKMLKEENITMLEENEAANLSILDSVTANPLPEDIIHFAIPVCAPYTALQKYKYKVKLTPGTLKRGKAIKQAHSVFVNLNDATAREKELIKSVPDTEAINAMMSKVKVSAPNLEASKRKKGKK